MRLVIDLQGAQTSSRFRGIGRYSLALSKALAKARGRREVLIVLSDQFPETLDPIRAEFGDILPTDNIRIWHALGPTRELDPGNERRREISERLREAFLASLQPDVILITSLFEGLVDDAVCSIGTLVTAIPTAVILYDLVPLVSPDPQFRDSLVSQAWYERKINTLERSDLLLAISDSSRMEALGINRFSDKEIVGISGACDESFREPKVSEEERRVVWGRYGIKRKFVMYTGGADQRKNLNRLIEAFSKLPVETRQRFQLVLVGKMPEGNVEGLYSTARFYGLAPGELLIPGYVNDADLVKLYGTCALFCFPSLHEGFGMPPLEAMACGAPVIGANSSSLPEVIGLSDAMFDPTSTTDMSMKMQQALTDDDFRAKLIWHGKSHHRNFTWNRSATIAFSALDGLVTGRASRVASILNVDSTAVFRKRKLRIIVTKLDHFGDFLLAIPAFSKLRARYAYASIEVVVGSWNVALAQETQLFDKVHTYDFFKQKASDPPKKNADVLAQLLNSLGDYDIGLDLRRPPDTRFLLVKIRAKLKIAYSTFDESMDNALQIIVPQPRDAAFVATVLNKTPISIQMLRVVDAVPPDPNDFVTFPAICGEQEPRLGNVAVFPKAGLAIREWSKENFQELVRLLAGDPFITGVNIYFATSREAAEFDFVRNDKISYGIGLSLSELANSLSGNSVCIANNSGGAHLASYLGVTSIGLYSGHELASEWGPQFFSAIAIHRAAQCAPCHGAKVSDCPNGLFCLGDISIEDVYTKTVEAIFAKGQKTASKLPGRAIVSLQMNTDSIVRQLLSSIAKLGRAGPPSVMDTAVAISRNHPDFSLNPDLRSFRLNAVTDHRSALIDWRGFSGIERDFRWSDGHQAAMLFECPADTPARGILLLHVACFGKQRIIAALNGVKVLDSVESGRHVRLRIPVRSLQSGFNSLEFELPDARQPGGGGDSRYLAIAVRHFEIRCEHPLNASRSIQ